MNLNKLKIGTTIVFTILKLFFFNFISRKLRFIFTKEKKIKSDKTAIVIFSRFHMNDEKFRLCGSGRMQLELIKALESIGYKVHFFGQEDKVIEKNKFVGVHLVITLATGAWRIPHTYLGMVWVLTANSNVSERIKRNQWIKKRYSLNLLEKPVLLKHLYAYQRADVLYIAENYNGIYHHLFNGIPEHKIVRYNNCTDTEIFSRTLTYKPNPVGSRRFVAWMTASIRKGLPLLLDTWLNWKNRENATLTIIGLNTNETNQIIKIFSEKLTERDDIIIKFGVNDYQNLALVLEGYDVSVFPTFEDAQPSQLLEMAAIGYPIITTYESGVEFENDFCLYISPWLSRSLEKALEQWNFSSEDILLNASNSSRKYIISNHNWDHFGKKFVDDLNKHQLVN
jgi:hypothetical protein